MDETSTIPVPTLADYAVQLQVLRAWEDEIAKPRHADPRRLLRYGFKTYAQNDEDGIIQGSSATASSSWSRAGVACGSKRGPTMPI
jgi:hypothetical protein